MTSAGTKRATLDRVFDRPDNRSRWWKDKAARHTCRVTGKACEYAFRCSYSLAETAGRAGRPHRTGVLADRLATCAFAIASGFRGSTCHGCPRRKACDWKCFFRERFADATPPPLSL
jgi:hypothetical protein